VVRHADTRRRCKSSDHRPGQLAHIPWYAIGCTLDSIAAQSNGRMKVIMNGQSALSRDK
jgi:hypothetical protein